MSDDPDVVVLTALDLEAEAFSLQLENWTTSTSGHRRYYRGTIDEKNVVVWPIGGMGNVSAAVATQQAIGVWNPKSLILSGIAGGISKDSSAFGDVLVPEQIVGYEPGKVLSNDVVRRYTVFRAASAFLHAAHFVASQNRWQQGIPATCAAKRKDRPTVHFGVLASGEKVIADKSWGINFRSHWPKAIGVDMEGVGAAQAAYDDQGRPDFGIIRAISDYADKEKGDSWQPYAAAAAAAFTVAVIRALAPPQPGPGRLQAQIRDSVLSTRAPDSKRAGWGQIKVQMCRRLKREEALDLADCFEIERYERDRFERPCQGIWEWLDDRGKLSHLPLMLQSCLGREDLVALVQDWCSKA